MEEFYTFMLKYNVYINICIYIYIHMEDRILTCLLLKGTIATITFIDKKEPQNLSSDMYIYIYHDLTPSKNLSSTTDGSEFIFVGYFIIQGPYSPCWWKHHGITPQFAKSWRFHTHGSRGDFPLGSHGRALAEDLFVLRTDVIGGSLQAGDKAGDVSRLSLTTSVFGQKLSKKL